MPDQRATDHPAPSEASAARASAPAGVEAELQRLPLHARNWLQVSVPVQVRLASQRKSVQEIIELGPGSIISFDKTFDEPLQLSVGDRTLAEGEVVKVGDKFGLRIRRLVNGSQR